MNIKLHASNISDDAYNVIEIDNVKKQYRLGTLVLHNNEIVDLVVESEAQRGSKHKDRRPGI